MCFFFVLFSSFLVGCGVLGFGFDMYVFFFWYVGKVFFLLGLVRVPYLSNPLLPLKGRRGLVFRSARSK